MSVIGNPLLLSPEGYQIERSVRLRSSASAYFNRTPASAGNRKTWTWSGWVKVGTLGVNRGLFGAQTTAGADANRLLVWLNSSDKIIVYEDISSTGNTYRLTTQVFRDPSAWYHIVLAFDTSNATAGDRVKLYVNGSQITTFDTNNAPTLNRDTFVNAALPHSLGADRASSLVAFDGYLTEVNFIDGQALTPSSFGETDAVTGVWKPKKYAGTYGTNGFYLNFSDPSAATAAAIGKDYSGNGNNWTANNISVTAGVTYDSMIDTPTPYADGGNGRGNYAVLNPLDKSLTDGSITNGNLTLNGTSNWNACRGSFGMSSGKWYWETVHSVYDQSLCGIADSVWPPSTYYPGYSTTGYAAAYGNNALKYVDGVNTSYGATFTIGDVIGYALDMDAGTLTCYKNGVSQGEMVSGLTAYGTIFPAIAAANGAVINANFGQRPFAYTPPTGFKALNTQNLPEPTIVDGSQYFDVSLFTGTGSAQTITNSGAMQPDLVWVKGRGEVASHRLVDSVRGVDKVVYSNLTNAEATEDGVVDSFNSNGFTGGGANAVTSGYAGVAWQWKANGAGVSNTDGSITSTVSAGVTQGFSVVTWTTPSTGIAYTIGHGLGVVPSLIIMKERTTGSTSWVTHHKAVMSNSSQYLLLNTTGAIASATNIFGSSMPSSTVFGNTSGTGINVSAQAVAYCFAEVPGFSKFGSYTGNGSTDGPFVHLGFRPAYVMIKVTNNTYDWEIADSSRSPDNFVDDFLVPNSSAAENANVGAANSIDFLSNGFKIRANWTRLNDASGTFIYMAFAEHPFKHSLAR